MTRFLENGDPLNVKRTLGALGIAMTLLLPALARAEDRMIDIYRPEKIVHPVALPAFDVTGGDAALGTAIPDAMGRDLVFTGLFKVIDRAAYLEKPGAVKVTGEGTNWDDWNVLKASLIVRGSIRADAGRLNATVAVFDVHGKNKIGERQISEPLTALGKLEHELADAAYELATGEKSFFSSRIAFVNNRAGNKELFMASFDGREETQVTRNRSINVSPAWSPDGKKLLFTSYVRAHPDLYLWDRTTDKFSRVSNREGINIGGVWAPQGRVLAATLSSEGGNPDIYLMQDDGRGMKRLTDHYGNDVSPTWSPDAQKIAFVSDRGGNPNVYVMSAQGTNPTRITFEKDGAGKDNENPSWSPRGDRIAFQARVGGAWQILTMKPDGSEAHAITSGGANEDPSWSPDGRMIACIRDGKVWVMEADGSNARAITSGAGTYSNVTWSPRLPW